MALNVFRALTVLEAVIVSLMAWLCFVVTVLFAGVLWAGKPLSQFFIAAGQYLLCILAMGIIAILMG
jgi:hypothetical protein